jgi:hypothetical protein
MSSFQNGGNAFSCAIHNTTSYDRKNKNSFTAIFGLKEKIQNENIRTSLVKDDHVRTIGSME